MHSVARAEGYVTFGRRHRFDAAFWALIVWRPRLLGDVSLRRRRTSTSRDVIECRLHASSSFDVIVCCRGQVTNQTIIS